MQRNSAPLFITVLLGGLIALCIVTYFAVQDAEEKYVQQQNAPAAEPFWRRQLVEIIPMLEE